MLEADKREIDGDAAYDALAVWLRMAELSGISEVFVGRAGHAGTSGHAAASGGKRVAGPHRAASNGDPSVEALMNEVQACSRCKLHGSRTNVVFGEGSGRSRLMFVGEAPGADEDRQGRPFVGRAGQLLTRIIHAMGIEREDTYITNVLKCRPPGNRDPEIDEISECLPYLEKQIERIRPEVICALGLFATHTLTGIRDPIGRMRGGTFEYRGIPLIPTYHPAACLRNPSSKKLVWEDIKRVMRILGLPIQGGMKHGAGKSKR